MSSARLTLRPPPHVEFIHGFPGIPPGAPDRPHASVRGTIELRIGTAPIKARWVQIELRKVEVLPGGAQYVDYIGQPSYKIWQAKEGEFAMLNSQDFPFSIRIPESIPPSISLEKGAGIRYELLASVCMKSKKGLLRRETVPTLSTVVAIEMDKHELHATWPIYSIPETRETAADLIKLTVDRGHTCYGQADKVTVNVTLKSDAVGATGLRGFEFTLKETIIFRAGPGGQTGASAKKNLGPQVKATIIGEQKVPVNVTLYGGMIHKAELGCLVPPNHTNTTVTTARHIDIGYTISVRALLENGKVIGLDLPVTISNWQRKESIEAIKRIGAPPAALEHPSRVHLIQQYDPRMSAAYNSNSALHPQAHPNQNQASLLGLGPPAPVKDPRYSMPLSHHPQAAATVPGRERASSLAGAGQYGGVAGGYAPGPPGAPGLGNNQYAGYGADGRPPGAGGPFGGPSAAGMAGGAYANTYGGYPGYQNGAKPDEFGLKGPNASPQYGTAPTANQYGQPAVQPGAQAGQGQLPAQGQYGGYVPPALQSPPAASAQPGYFDPSGPGTVPATIPQTQPTARRPKSNSNANPTQRFTIVNYDPADEYETSPDGLGAQIEAQSRGAAKKYLTAEEEKMKLRETDAKRERLERERRDREREAQAERERAERERAERERAERERAEREQAEMEREARERASSNAGGSSQNPKPQRTWLTAEQEKARLFEDAKAATERAQARARQQLQQEQQNEAIVESPAYEPPTATPSTNYQPSQHYQPSSPPPMKPQQQWLTAEDEKRRLFENAQAAVQQRHAQAQGSGTSSGQQQNQARSSSMDSHDTNLPYMNPTAALAGGAPSYNAPSATGFATGQSGSAYNQGGSGSYMSTTAASPPAKMSAAAELYARAMAAVKTPPARQGSPGASSLGNTSSQIHGTSGSAFGYAPSALNNTVGGSGNSGGAYGGSNSQLNGSVYSPVVPTPKPASPPLPSASASAKPQRHWPSAEEEKASMRYEQARRAVEKRTGLAGDYPAASSSNGHANPMSPVTGSSAAQMPVIAPLQVNKPGTPSADHHSGSRADYIAAPSLDNGGYNDISPTPPPPSEMPPAWGPSTTYGYTSALSEKEKTRLAYEAQDAVAAAAPPDYDRPPMSPPPGPPQPMSPVIIAPTPQSLSSARASAVSPSISSGSAPLTAVQEKARLRAQYAREEASDTFSQQPPAFSSGPMSPTLGPMSPGGSRIMSPPPPPPLAARTMSPPLSPQTPSQLLAAASRNNSLPQPPGQSRAKPPLPSIEGSGYRPLTAVEEKARLRAQYEAEEAGPGSSSSSAAPPAWSPTPPPASTVSSVRPSILTAQSPSVMSNFSSGSDLPTRDPSISLGKQKAFVVPPPPPLLPKPPVSYIQATRAEDARASTLGHGASYDDDDDDEDDAEHTRWATAKDSSPWAPPRLTVPEFNAGFSLDIKPFTPLEVSLDHIRGSPVNGGPPPPLPPKVRLDI